MTKSRSRWAYTLVTIGTILAVITCLSLWVKRQLLDTNYWVKTSSSLIANPKVQQATADYLSDQIFSSAQTQSAVTEKLDSVLPPRLAPLAPTIAGALSTAADKVALRALESSAFQKIWTVANRNAHQQFRGVIDGKYGTGTNVTLDLRPMIQQLAAKVGLSSQVNSALPPNAGLVTVMQSKNLGTLRTAAHILQTLAWLLVLITIAVFLSAIYIAKGRRAKILAASGAGFVIAALIVLVARRLLGHEVVGIATKNVAIVPAANATWVIGTSVLRDIAFTMAFLGIVVFIAGWLAGAGNYSTKSRHVLAPYLVDRPGIGFGVVGAVMLVLLAWGPFPATRTLLGVVLLLVFAFGGTFALRQEMIAEGEGAHPEVAEA
jgi:hypothetical protein